MGEESGAVVAAGEDELDKRSLFVTPAFSIN